MNSDLTVTCARPRLVPDDSRREETAIRTRYSLTFLRGRYQGKSVSIDARRGYTVGRGEGCDIAIDDVSVSRLHLVFETDDGEGLQIRDWRSRNGTFVNSRRLDPYAVVQVRPGDKIQIGEETVVRIDAFDQLTDDAQNELYAAAVRDPLTGIFNKRYLLESLRRDFALAKRHGVHLNAILVDVDHFKAVNDTHGHLVGDEVLKKLARATSLLLRAEDLFGRFGGEEFVIVTKNQSLEAAISLAERLRAAIGRQALVCDGVSVPVTISLGVAGTGVKVYDDVDALLRDADAMLYRAKASGRNQVAGVSV